jgi:vitamin B12 transporter
MWKILLICWLPTLVSAAEPVPVITANEEVVVTAARIPLPIKLAGSGVTVITRAEIERRNPQYLTELLRDVPGFAVSRNGGAGAQTQVRVRGAEGNHLLVLIDGIEANDFSQNDEFDFAHLTASDVERVEIVRGPQSALWGSDALAGVVNIITRDAKRPLEIDGQAEYGAFGTKQGALAVGGNRGTLRGRLSLSYLDAGGINVASRGTEDDGYRNATVNLKLGWQPIERLQLALNGRVTDAENEFDTPDFDTLFDGRNRDVPATIDLVQGYVGGRAELATFERHWTHTLKAGWTKLGNVTEDPTDAGTRRTEGRKYALGYQSNWRFDTRWMLALAHSFTLAADYDLEEFTQRGPVVFGADPNQNHRHHTVGYIGEYRATLAEFTSLGISGRWDDNSDFADIGTFRVSFAQELPISGTVLSAAYGTGHKAPTFSERYGFFSNGGLPFIGNENLEPEQSHGYEIGIRQTLWAGRASLGATYFNEKLTDEIDGFVFDGIGIFTAANRAGTSRREGVELSTRVALTEQLAVNGSYTYLDATELSNGLRLDEVRRPHHQGALSANWRGLAERLTLDAHLTHNGKRDDLTFLPPTFAGRTELAAYTLAGISAAYQITKSVALTARVENLFDDEYQDVFDFQTEGVSGFVGFKFALEP